MTSVDYVLSDKDTESSSLPKSISESVAGNKKVDDINSNIPTATHKQTSHSPKTFKRYEYLNPFVHTLNIEDTFDNAKIYVMTVLLVPIRIVCMILSILVAYAFAFIGQYGCDLQEKPLTGWRLVFQQLTALSMRQMYACGSFHYINVIGEKANAKEAPVIVVAPHSSYVDSVAIVSMGPPAIVAKQETAEIPLFGKLVNYSQPIYVIREDPNSRQNTIKQIKDRTNSKENWPQTALFPEGTCTNRKALITFKPGAFYPGVPVQPVILRYPNKYDTFTWTWEGPGVLQLLWITMTQLYSRLEMEYLPVYVPSEAEKQDAKLFANNVRAVMAKALNVPVCDYSFEDCIFMQKAKDMLTPLSKDIVEIERCLHKLGLFIKTIDEEVAEEYLNYLSDSVDIFAFAKILKIDATGEYAQRLFSLLNKTAEEKVSLKDYLLCSLFVRKVNEPVIEYLRAVTGIYCKSKKQISRESFNQIVRHCKRLSKDGDALFLAIDHTNRGSISFDEFEEYTKDKPEYSILFKAKDHIRRPVEK